MAKNFLFVIPSYFTEMVSASVIGFRVSASQINALSLNTFVSDIVV